MRSLQATKGLHVIGVSLFKCLSAPGVSEWVLLLQQSFQILVILAWTFDMPKGRTKEHSLAN